jgi:hypothetical protein
MSLGILLDPSEMNGYRRREGETMGDLRQLRKEPVHIRTITTTTYRVDDETIMMEGVLNDDRLIQSYSMAKGTVIDPGVVHAITIRLLIRGAGMIIDDVEVEITHVPREACRETLEALKPLIGQRIAPGFTELIKKTFGGARGCAHQNALLLAMASAAVQGFWTNRAGKPLSIQEARKMDPRFLIDTCWVWRADGPLVKELEKALQEQSEVV